MLKRIHITLLLTAFSVNGFAEVRQIALPTPQLEAQASIVPDPPSIHAKAYLLADFQSGRVLAEDHAGERIEPASMTKIMSLYIIASHLKSQQIHMDDKVRVSTKAWKTKGSRMFVKPGTDVAVKDLIQGMAVQSGNDASVAMAEYVAGSEDAFVDLMNKTAQQLGMKDTHFMNSIGLSNPQHYTTVTDLFILTSAWIKNFPEYYPWFKQQWFKYNGIKQPNRNRLLWRDPRVDGVKTGHTDSAGYCLVSSAIKDNMRLIAIVAKTPSDTARTTSSESLLSFGFRFYETHKLYSTGAVLSQARTWNGEQETTDLGVAHDFYATLPTGDYKKIKIDMHINDPLEAPLQKGQVVGMVTATLHGEELATEQLVALADNPLGDWMTRFHDQVEQKFSAWFA